MKYVSRHSVKQKAGLWHWGTADDERFTQLSMSWCMELKDFFWRGKCGQRRPRSTRAYARADQGLRCPLIELFNTAAYCNRHKKDLDQTGQMHMQIWGFVIRIYPETLTDNYSYNSIQADNSMLWLLYAIAAHLSFSETYTKGHLPSTANSL